MAQAGKRAPFNFFLIHQLSKKVDQHHLAQTVHHDLPTAVIRSNLELKH